MKSLVALATIAVAFVACAPPVVSNYATVSTHTIQIAPDKQADVVWLQQYKDDRLVLMRCHNSPEGAECVRVKTP
ncbi:hypothetical protein BH09MYX1_BH09MYX1_10740 [soil metagenome]